MRLRRRWLILLIGSGGVLLLALATLTRIAHGPPILDQPYAPVPPRDPCERTLREAREWQLRAVRSVNEEREALEADASAPVPGDIREAQWRKLMARDHSGYLRRARAAAQRAAALARTPEEEYHTTLLLTRLECYAGHHAQELRLARRLVELQPDGESAMQALRRAEACNGMKLTSPRQPTTGEWEMRARHTTTWH
jgi:hypothetical protein